MDPYGTYPRHPAPFPHGQERVGHVQRTVVLDLLGRAAAEGYLDLDEYEGRVGAVTVSRTVSELNAVLVDLPAQFRWNPAQPVPKSPQQRERDSASSMAMVGLVLGAASIPTSMCIGTGGLLGLIAVVLARKGMHDDESRSKAVIGMVLGMIGLAMSLGVVVLTVLG
jgi:hypothetical protein